MNTRTGTRQTAKPWWEDLDLSAATKRLLANRDADTPEALAGEVRAVPEAFRQMFDEEARAELARALTTYLAQHAGGEVGGYRDLLEALEELAGTRKPRAQPPLPRLGLGVVIDPSTEKGASTGIPPLAPPPRRKPKRAPLKPD